MREQIESNNNISPFIDKAMHFLKNENNTVDFPSINEIASNIDNLLEELPEMEYFIEKLLENIEWKNNEEVLLAQFTSIIARDNLKDDINSLENEIIS